jgi:hypothetical protein
MAIHRAQEIDAAQGVDPSPFGAALKHTELDLRARIEERGDAFASGQVAAGVDTFDGVGAAAVMGARPRFVDGFDLLLVQGRTPRRRGCLYIPEDLRKTY